VTEDDRAALLRRLRTKSGRPGHRIVADTLRDLGITHVYAVRGTPIDNVLGSCARVGLRVIGARHQQSAVLMSLAHNYVAGGLCAACVVSAASAITNSATGLMYGLDNRWPALVIGGRRSWTRRGGFQAFDGARFVAPIVKHAASVDGTHLLAGALREAAAASMSGAPGPAYVDIHEAALAGTAPATRARAPQAETGNTAATSVDAAVALIGASRRRALVIGKGARWSSPSSLLRRLVDNHDFAFAASPMGRGLLPDDDPRCASTVRAAMLGHADVVVVVGARFDWTWRYGCEIGADTRIVHIDIDAAEAQDVLGRGIGLQGDAAAVLQALIDRLDRGAPHAADPDRDWLAELQALRDARRHDAVPESERGHLPMSPYEWLGELRDALPDPVVTILDGNVVMSAANRLLPVRHPAHRMTPGSGGLMGGGIPFAIGAAVARPDRPVVAIVGDFAAGLSGFEFETAVRHHVPIVVVVANNAGPGGATAQDRHFPPQHDERSCRFHPEVRHDLMMASLGGRGWRVDAPGQLGPALTEALACGGPACIDVLTNEHTALRPVL
jgi:2-hydroxyacyl-CoA lyase 1